MKKSWWSLFLLIVCHFSVSAQSFQGTFLIQVQDDHTISQMNVWVRGDRVMLQPVDPSFPPDLKILFIKNSPDVYVLRAPEGQKTAVLYHFNPPPADPAAAYHLTEQVTGQTKNLEGYSCKEVMLDDGKGQKVQLWVTDSLGFTMADFSDCLAKFSSTLNGGDYYEAIKYNASEAYKKGMALEVNDLKTKDATHIWIKEIKIFQLPAADFMLEGYKIFDANQLNQGGPGQ